MKTLEVTLSLLPEHQALLVAALRFAADRAQERINSGEANAGLDQPSQTRWLATYIEHKIRDAR